MFSNLTIAFLVAVSAGAWVYSKMQLQTGGNTPNSLVVAGFAALGSFLVIITVLQFFLS